MKHIALATQKTASGQTIITGANNTRGKLWLPVGSDLDLSTRAALTLLAGGDEQIAADVPEELVATPQLFFVPSRQKLRSEVAVHQRFPDLRGVAEQLTQGTIWGAQYERVVVDGQVFTDASVMSSGSAVGWATPDGQCHVQLSPQGVPIHLLEMEAIVLAVEGTQGDVEVFSDCKNALRALTGECKVHSWRDEIGVLADRLRRARKGRAVSLSWVRGHGTNMVNRQVDTLVRSAAMCSPAM